MRYTIEGPQKKFFLQNGWLELEGILKESAVNALMQSIEKVISDYPGDRFERGQFLSRSLPEIVQMVRRHHFADIAYELTDEKPLRLAYDHAFPSFSSDQKNSFLPYISQPGNVCCLLLTLEKDCTAKGIFFNEKGFENLYIPPSQWYLLFIFSTNYLNERFHPVITSK